MDAQQAAGGMVSDRPRATGRRDLLRRQGLALRGRPNPVDQLHPGGAASAARRLTGMNRSPFPADSKDPRRLSDRTYLACLASRDRFSVRSGVLRHLNEACLSRGSRELRPALLPRRAIVDQSERPLATGASPDCVSIVQN